MFNWCCRLGFSVMKMMRELWSVLLPTCSGYMQIIRVIWMIDNVKKPQNQNEIPGGGGGGDSGTEGAAPALCISRKKGYFLRPPYVRDFVKEGYFFVPRYEVWGSKSPYNPGNIRCSDAEWLPKWLGFRVCCRHLLPLNTQRIIKS